MSGPSPTSNSGNFLNSATDVLTLGAVNNVSNATNSTPTVNGWAADATETLKTVINGPNLQSPDANSSTPTVGQANTMALQSQLASESAASAYGTVLTGGAGLLTAPTTTSRTLLGS